MLVFLKHRNAGARPCSCLLFVDPLVDLDCVRGIVGILALLWLGFGFGIEYYY